MRSEVHEETIGAPPVDVWGFMVDPAALSAWFGADAWLEPSVGETVRFLRWRWREHHGAGFGSRIGETSTVAIELSPVDGGTRVRIVETPAVRAVSRST